MKILLAIISLILCILLSLSTALTSWESIGIGLFIYFFFEFLYNLGRRLVILDLTIILALFTWVVMPAIFYHNYTRDNFLARLWVKYMMVPSDKYFAFVIPGTIMLVLGLRTPLKKLRGNVSVENYFERVKIKLAESPKIGQMLIITGVISGLLNFIAPENLKQVFYLSNHLTYVGVFYVLYSPNKYRRVLIPGVIAIMLGQTLITGMFGEMVYILALSAILMLIGKRISFSRKLSLAVVGLFVILIIQSIKSDYRQRNWREGAGADPVYFAQLIGDRVTSPGEMFDANKLFFIAVRMNQGWLVSMTMYMVPAKHSFANGETVWQSVAASIVPRFLWPDKPESGGAANLKRFWGFDLRGYSMNIGPIGEAYANFDTTGGIIFMYFYGLFFNFMLTMILRMADKRPTLILWLPYLFLHAVNVETDMLTTVNSLLKGVLFVWIVFHAFRIFFRTEL